MKSPIFLFVDYENEEQLKENLMHGVGVACVRVLCSPQEKCDFEFVLKECWNEKFNVGKIRKEMYRSSLPK